MRLNFYSRRRRFNKSLLGSHKNSLTLTKKRSLCSLQKRQGCFITDSQPPAINIDKIYIVESIRSHTSHKNSFTKKRSLCSLQKQQHCLITNSQPSFAGEAVNGECSAEKSENNNSDEKHHIAQV